MHKFDTCSYNVSSRYNQFAYQQFLFFFSFRNPVQVVRQQNRRCFDWPKYESETQSYLEISKQMSRESVKQRLSARKVEFWSNYIPSMLNKN